MAPRSEPRPCCISFTPSGASSASMISREKPLCSRFSWNSSQMLVTPGLVLAHPVVVGQRVAEEVGAVDAPVDGGLLVLVAHHRQHDRHVGVHREAGGHALLGLDQLVVLLHPLAGVLGLDERERERADAVAGGEVDGLPAAARHPQRRVRLLERLGHHVARRHPDELGVPARERLLHEHARDRIHRVLPHLALARAVDQEAAQLGGRGRLAGAEVHAAVGDEVERGHPLGHPRRVVDRRAGSGRCRGPAGCARCAGWRRPGRPPGAEEWEYSSRKWCSTSQT